MSVSRNRLLLLIKEVKETITQSYREPKPASAIYAQYSVHSLGHEVADVDGYLVSSFYVPKHDAHREVADSCRLVHATIRHLELHVGVKELGFWFRQFIVQIP